MYISHEFFAKIVHFYHNYNLLLFCDYNKDKDNK